MVMCLAVQAATCPDRCSCRDVVTCYGPIRGELPPTTTGLVLRPSAPPDVPQLLAVIDELHHLAHLSLVGCSIRDLDNVTFAGLDRLRTLDLSHNLITELSEETFNQTELRVLDVSHNSIRTVHGSPFRNLCSLELLNLSGNAIDSIPMDTFSGLRALNALDLATNNITLLQSKMFAPLVSLQQLNLSKNQLETLTETCFANLQRLQQLDLSWNRLTHMAPGTLQALPSLSRLMIAGNSALGGGNKDAALLVGTGRRLQTLDASRTGLEHVPAALTHSVRTLRIAGNSIRTVQCGDLDSYPLLQLLDMTTNLLEEMEEDALGRLEMLVVLYLTDNKLHAIPRSLPDELKILHLEFNRIEQIVSGDLLGLPKLEVLLLNDNNIKVVQEGAFSQMTSLITLDLSRNPISILPAGTLSGPARLQVLRLSSLTVDPPAEDMTFPVSSPEHLVRLDLSYSPGLARQLLADKAALVAFRELQELNMTGADLINIRSDLLHFLPQLRDLHITGNRLNCSGLLWLALWMRVQDQPEHREVVCVSPPELYGTLVVDLQDTDMETTTVTVKITATDRTAVTTDKTTTTTMMETVSEAAFEASTENTDKTFWEKKNETARASSVTALSGNRFVAPDSVTRTVTDGHSNPSDNRIGTEITNYVTETNTARSETSTAATAGINSVAAVFHANQPDNSSLNKPRWHDREILQNDLFTTAKHGNATSTPDTSDGNASVAATGQMSMYRTQDNGRTGEFMHPGMLVLFAGVVGVGIALSTLISHIRKRRKRNADNGGCYSRQQDIEVNSLPGFSELW